MEIMATVSIEERIETLEREVEILKSSFEKANKNGERWWEMLAGTFKNDSTFDEIVDAGKKYRRSKRLKFE